MKRTWRLALFVAALAVIACGCGGKENGPTTKPAKVPPVKPPAKPPGPQDVPRDVIYKPPAPGIIGEYIGGALGTLRRAQVMAGLYPIQQWLDVRGASGEPFPKDMNELVRQYGRRNIKPAPAGYKLFYWPAEGQVRMVPEKDPRFADPQGVHTIKDGGAR